jgi:hypothetical protein
VRGIVQVREILDTAEEAGQEFDQFGLRSERARLLRNRYLHQLVQQTVLLQKLTEGHEQSMIGVRKRPV